MPPHYVDMIERDAIWDAHNDQYIIPGVEFAFNSIADHMGDPAGVGLGAAVSGGAGVGFRRRDPLHMAVRMATQALGGPAAGVGGARGAGGGFDPTRQELPPEVQQALQAAVSAQLRSAPKEAFFTYQGAVPQPQQAGGAALDQSGGRRKR